MRNDKLRDLEKKGVIFVNQYKKTEKQPDFTGKFTLDGEEFRIDGWEKETGEGKWMISFNIHRLADLQRETPSRDMRSPLDR